MEERDNINKFRKKRAGRKLMFRLAVLLLIVLVIILIIINWGSIIAPFKDAALDVSKGGFPVELPGSAGYTLNELGESFYLLTDTYIYTYHADGAQITNVQHGFQNPVSESNHKRVVVYDKNGKGFKLFSRTGEIYSKPMEDSIVFASIGNDDRCAVVTTSTRYSNYLYVYNGEGKQIFRWASPNYKIMQVEFSKDDKSIFVSALGAQNGELQQYIFRFDLGNAESHIWQTYIGSDISYELSCDSKSVYAITGGSCSRLDIETGELLSSGVFSNTIHDIPRQDGAVCIVFSDPTSSGDVLTVYDDTLTDPKTLYIDKLTRACTDSGKYYVLSGSQLRSYDGALQEIKIYELDDVYSDMIIMNGYAYLLGYNEVQRVAL